MPKALRAQEKNYSDAWEWWNIIKPKLCWLRKDPVEVHGRKAPWWGDVYVRLVKNVWKCNWSKCLFDVQGLVGRWTTANHPYRNGRTNQQSFFDLPKCRVKRSWSVGTSSDPDWKKFGANPRQETSNSERTSSAMAKKKWINTMKKWRKVPFNPLIEVFGIGLVHK